MPQNTCNMLENLLSLEIHDSCWKFCNPMETLSASKILTRFLILMKYTPHRVDIGSKIFDAVHLTIVFLSLPFHQIRILLMPLNLPFQT